MLTTTEIGTRVTQTHRHCHKVCHQRRPFRGIVRFLATRLQLLCFLLLQAWRSSSDCSSNCSSDSRYWRCSSNNNNSSSNSSNKAGSHPTCWRRCSGRCRAERSSRSRRSTDSTGSRPATRGRPATCTRHVDKLCTNWRTRTFVKLVRGRKRFMVPFSHGRTDAL